MQMKKTRILASHSYYSFSHCSLFASAIASFVIFLLLTVHQPLLATTIVPLEDTEVPDSEETPPQSPSLDEQQVQKLLEMIADNPQIKDDMLQRFPQLADALKEDQPKDASEPKPGESPEDAFRKSEQKRALAEALVAELATADEDQLARIEKDLTNLGSEALIPLKLAELSDNFELRRRAVIISSRIRWRLVASEALLRSHPKLVEIMSGQDAEARAALVEKIVRLHLSSSLEFLGECLADPQIYVRQRAIDGLIGIGKRFSGRKSSPTKDRVSELLQVALDDDDRNIRLLAVGAMAQIQAVKPARLAEMLDDDSLEVRTTVIRAMGHSGNSDAVKYIIPFLEDPEWRIRAAVLEALEQLVEYGKPSAAAPDVINRLNDPDEYVRELAVKLLGQWQYRKAARQILTLVKAGQISEEAGFAALAAMKDPAGKAEMMRLYDAARTPARRKQLLTVMNHYVPDPAVDAKLRQALTDQAMQPHWPELMHLAAYRDNSEQFFPLISKYLEHPDKEIAAAAWSVISNIIRYDQTKIPKDIVKNLLHSHDPERVRWALIAQHIAADQNYIETLKYALEHTNPEVVNLALGIIAKELIKDSLGQDLPTFYRHEIPGSSNLTTTFTELPDLFTEPISRCLLHSDPGVQLRAAAILYSAAERRDQQVENILRRSLTDPQLRPIALAGIVENPRPFLKDFDLDAAAKDQTTYKYAVAIMGNIGGPQYTNTLIELAKDVTHEDHALLNALLRTADPKALDIVKKTFKDPQDWHLREFVKTLSGRSGKGTVDFVAWTLSQLKDEPWEYSETLDVLVTLPDPSVKDVLHNILDELDKKESGRDHYQIRSKVLARLAVLDPQGSIAILQEMLQSDDASQQRTALDAITKTEPTEQNIKIILKVATRKSKIPAGQWIGAIDWLPEDDLQKKFITSLSQLDPPVQYVVLRRISRDLKSRDLQMLLSVSPKGVFLQEFVAGMIGVLTADDPAKQVVPEKLSPESLAAVLSAAGEWPNAPDVFLPYLKDPHSEVTAGLARGLANHALGYPQAQFTDAHRDVLISAVKSSNSITAYLASEALAIRWPEEFLALDSTEVKSLPAACRLAVAHGDDLPEPLRKKLTSVYTGKGGTTALRLAVVAAGQAKKIDAGRRLPLAVSKLNRRQDWPLIVDAAVSTGNEAVLLRLVNTVTPARLLQHNPHVAPLIEKLLARARKSDGLLFTSLATHGWIATPDPGDLQRLLKFSLRSANEYGLFTDYRRSPLLDLALKWAPDQPDQEILKLISAKKTSGILAAAIAAINWKLPQGRKALLLAATSNPKSTANNVVNRRRLALSALAVCSQPQDAKPLLAVLKQTDRDDWQTRELLGDLLTAVARTDPALALDWLKANTSDFSPYDMDQLSPHEILASLADAEIEPDDLELTPSHRSTDTPHSELFQALTTARHSLPSIDPSQPTPDPDAQNTRPPSAYDPAEQQNLLILLPPWITPLDDRELPIVLGGREVAEDRLRRALSELQQEEDRQEEEFFRAYISSDERLSHLSAEVSYSYDGPYFPSASLQPPSLGRIRLAAMLTSISLALPSAYLPEEWIAQQFRPLLSDEDKQTRIRAIRMAGRHLIESLTEDLALFLDSDDPDEVLEAAKALASMHTEPSVQHIKAAYDTQQDFNLRVQLACLLQQSGSDAPNPDIERAIPLYTIRSFRLKFIRREPKSVSYRSSSQLTRHRRSSVSYPGVPDESPSTVLDRTLPWIDALRAAVPRQLQAVDDRFPLPLHQSQHPPQPAVPVAVSSDLSGLHFQHGALEAPHLIGNNLPLAKLATGTGWDVPLFAELCAAEQDLEPHFYVQFADQSENLLQLRDHWLTWWQANKDQPREIWWQQGLRQAVAELTHQNWWHRMRAARRLMRLTGKLVVPPNAFDLPAWQRLQQQWQQLLEQNEKLTPAQWLFAEAVQAGLLGPKTKELPDDAPARLNALISLASSAPYPLSETALLHLETWPDRLQLIQASLPWQRSPRRTLAFWAMDKLQKLTGHNRFIYTPADLPEPAATNSPP